MGADGDGLHEGDPGGRDAVDRQALPRPRRHRDRHPPRPRGHRAPAGAARRGGARAVQGRDRGRHRRRHVHPHPPARARPDRGPARDAQPARSSPGLLRQELGFDGLVFTDSMSMHAISRRFTPEKAAAMAVAAGADVVLDPPDPEAALRGIREAVERGEIPREQVDRSVERILRAKARLGLHRARTVDVEAVPAGARGPRPRGGGGGGRLEGDHAGEGRPRPGAAPAARGRPRAAAVGRSTTRAAGARGRRGGC